MADWTLNLGGNLESKSLSSAKSVDVLTAALKAEERALKSSEVALARSAAAGAQNTKAHQKITASAVAAADKVSVLKKQLAASGLGSRFGAFTKGLKESFGNTSVVAGIRNVRDAIKGMSFEKLGQAAGKAPDVLIGALSTGLKVAAISMGIATIAAVGLASKLYDIAKAALTAGVQFADEARSARLLNEAADLAGGTHQQLSGIIEDVNRRATIGKDRIAELGRALRIARFDSRQTQLTLSAMATAESALGQGASGAVRGIADASRATRRFSLGMRDAYGEYESLKAAGLTKGEVFSTLAKQLGTSTGEIQRRVGAGGVSITQGMRAIEAALSSKFGANVAKQALGLDRTFAKLRENFVQLFAGANIEPILKGLNGVAALFSRDTAEGRAFGEIVSRLMNEVGKTIESLTPQFKEFIVGLGADAAKPGGLADTIRGWISDAKNLGSTLNDVAKSLKDIASAAQTIGGAISTVTGSVTHKADQTELDRSNRESDIYRQLQAQGKKDGEALTAGVSAGIESGTPSTVGSITAFSAALNTAFKAANLIKSPSKLYERDARQIPAGAGQGVEAGTPRAVAAVRDMSAEMFRGFDLPAPSAAPPASKGGDVYHLHVENHGIPGAEDIGPELVRWIKYANDGGPRPAHV